MARLQALKPRLRPVANRTPVMQPGSWRTDQLSSTKRGYGYAWQKARMGFLRSHPLCVYCLRQPEYAVVREMDASASVMRCVELGLPVPTATVVDHIIDHRGEQNLFWDKANWQSLCATHHSRDKQREEAARR